jgi:hypothetical protein
MGLFVGQRCAKGSNPDVTALAGEGDGDRIHGAFHDHRDSTDGELVVEEAEQLGSLVEQRGVAGVDVFGSGQVDIGEVGTPSTDGSEDLAVMDDREDDPVAESVDRSAGACGDGDTGDQHFFVGDPQLSEVVDEVGPACGCLTGLEPGIVGEVCAEPIDQILLSPRGWEAVAEVGEAELVDLNHALLADRAFPPGHCSGEHAVDVGVGLFGRPGHVAKHRGNRQIWFEVGVGNRPVRDRDFGRRSDS